MPNKKLHPGFAAILILVLLGAVAIFAGAFFIKFGSSTKNTTQTSTNLNTATKNESVNSENKVSIEVNDFIWALEPVVTKQSDKFDKSEYALNETSYPWQNKDGTFISIKGGILNMTLKGYKDLSSKYLSKLDVDKSADALNSYFLTKGFTLVSGNPAFTTLPAPNPSDLDYIKSGGYTNSTYYCSYSFTINGNPAGYIMCGNQDIKADQQRAQLTEFMKASYPEAKYFTIKNNLENYVLIEPYKMGVAVGYTPLVIAKKQDDKWIKIIEVGSLEPPPCKMLDASGVPRKIVTLCYADNNKDMIQTKDNTIYKY